MLLSCILTSTQLPLVTALIFPRFFQSLAQMFASHTRPRILKAVPYSQDVTLGCAWDGLKAVHAMTMRGFTQLL